MCPSPFLEKSQVFKTKQQQNDRVRCFKNTEKLTALSTIPRQYIMYCQFVQNFEYHAKYILEYELYINTTWFVVGKWILNLTFFVTIMVTLKVCIFYLVVK